MVRQRVHAVALGYEDLNDHDALRDDPVVQTACERDESLASSSTLCRFEQRAERQWAIAIQHQLVEQFIGSFAHRPEELVLDFDATDDPVHGRQPGRFFHGYYDCYCFLPLYVFCGQQLLVAYLRPSNIDASKHAWAILSLLVKRLRQAWPEVRIVFRGDSGFCRHRMLDWCDRNNVRYIVGLARNAVLEREVAVACEVAKDGFEATGTKNRLFHEFQYAAGSWRRTRRVVARIEHGPKGRNPRFIVTNLEGWHPGAHLRARRHPGDAVGRVPRHRGARRQRTAGVRVAGPHAVERRPVRRYDAPCAQRSSRMMFPTSSTRPSQSGKTTVVEPSSSTMAGPRKLPSGGRSSRR